MRSAAPIPQSTQLLLMGASGLLSAVLFLSAGSAVFGISMNPGENLQILGLIVFMPLLMLGLTFNVMAVLIACAIATACISFFADNALPAIKFAVMVAVPALFFCQRALLNRSVTAEDPKTGKAHLEWYPFDRLTQQLTLLGAGLYAVIATMLTEIESLTAQVQALVQFVVDTLIIPSLAETDLSLAEQAELTNVDQLTEFFLPYYAGLVVLNILLILCANGLLAQSALKLSGRLKRSEMKIADLQPDRALTLIFTGLFVVSLLIGGITAAYLQGLALIGIFFFTFAGLGIIHRWFRAKDETLIWLIVFYSIFILLMPLSLIAVCLVGFAHPLFQRSTKRERR